MTQNAAMEDLVQLARISTCTVSCDFIVRLIVILAQLVVNSLSTYLTMFHGIPKQ